MLNVPTEEIGGGVTLGALPVTLRKVSETALSMEGSFVTTAFHSTAP
jgi:hypothetical protein